MTAKLEYVTREVRRIVTINSADNRMEPVWQGENLSWLGFNTISGRHEIECFFAIEFEQEQVDAWTTVQNIIDDVMNLWVSPITDPVTPKSGIVGHVGEEAVMPPFRMEKGQMILNEVALSKRKSPNFIDEAAHMEKPSEVINRIERYDVERFRANCTHPRNAVDVYQQIATKSAIYPGKGTPFGLMYAALGLAEAGEVQNKVKKAFRDDGVLRFERVKWVAHWYGSEPNKGCNIWSLNDHGLPSELLFHVGPDEKDLETGRRICEAHNAAITVEYQAITPERRTQIIKELGGVLWYIAAVCDEIGATMSEVALQNLDELCGRGERNTLRGDGDNR